MKNVEKIKNILHSNFPKLKENFGISRILLFGSYVNGNQKVGSDIDILVEFDRELSLLGVVEVEQHISELLHIKVDLIPIDDLREEIRDSVLREAVTV